MQDPGACLHPALIRAFNISTTEVSQINRPLAQFWTSLIDVCSTEIIENDAGQVLDGAIRLRCNLILISLDLEFVQQLEGQHSFRCQADTLSGTETERLISVELGRPSRSTTAQIVLLPAYMNLLQSYTEGLVLVAEKDDDSGVDIYR